MARPRCQRFVATVPMAALFRPAGTRGGGEVAMTLDELEALRLADLDGLYQLQAARRMGVSRATFGRIVEAARRKVAQALVEGRGLRIEGGPVIAVAPRGNCAVCEVASGARGTCASCACPERVVGIGPSRPAPDAAPRAKARAGRVHPK
jgi:predicted DNA-binding protein (UPF0251 family)